MEIPEPVIAAVKKATLDNLGDVEAAIPAAIVAVRGLKGFALYKDALINQAIQSLVYDYRHQNNGAVGKDAAYTGPPKVNVGQSEQLKQVWQSVYSHAIGGRMLGDLTAADLPALIEQSRAAKIGAAFNESILLWCQGKLGKDKRPIRKAIKEEELKKIYARLKRGTDRGRAAA